MFCIQVKDYLGYQKIKITIGYVDEQLESITTFSEQLVNLFVLP